MNRTVRIAPMLALIGVLFFCSWAPAKPPNVVMILSDDQGWGDYGFMGHPIIKTPNLDRLASEGLVFPRGYVPTSLCRPSLATLATGLYPHQHKSTGNDPPKRPRPEFLRLRREMIDDFERVPALPHLLAKQGYLSFQSGKWWEGHYSRGGFTHGMTHGDPNRGGRHGDVGLTIGREGMKPVFDFIDQAGERPFFVWYAPFMPHLPHNPPKRLLDKYTAPDRPIQLARYYAMCEWFDETCGQLLGYLAEKGLAEETIVVYVCDNGWIQNVRPHPGTPTWAGAPKGKASVYDGGIRSPIMVRWPGHIQPARIDTPVISIDLVPTILAACGLEPTAEMPGINLMDAKAVARRKAIFGEIFDHNAVDIDKPATSLRYRWCVEGRWKLIVPHAPNVPGGEPELYDVVADPHETKNLFKEHPDKAAHLRELIEQWWPVSDNLWSRSSGQT